MGGSHQGENRRVTDHPTLRKTQGAVIVKGWEAKQEKRKDTKTWKSRSEEKVVDFSSDSLFPTRKWEAVTQGGTTVIDQLTQRTQGGQARPQTYSRYIHAKQE